MNNRAPNFTNKREEKLGKMKMIILHKSNLANKRLENMIKIYKRFKYNKVGNLSIVTKNRKAKQIHGIMADKW